MFSFGGFGTLGVVHSSEDAADFTGKSLQGAGAGYTSSWSASVDSLIGAQVTANFSPTLSAVVQAIAQQNYDRSFTPHVEWANLKWQITPDFDLRAGRTALPIFLFTDTRSVGYATPWVRLPVEVYSLIPLTSNDGVDANYRFTVGTATNVLQIVAGRADASAPRVDGHPTGKIHSRGAVTVADSYEQGPTMLHISYSRAKVTVVALDPLFDAFRQFGPQGMALADRYNTHNALLTFYGLGASYDPGKWFALGEWAKGLSHTALGTSTGWYVSSGYHLRKFKPYATYASLKADTNTSDPGLTVAGQPPSLAGPAAGLNGALNSVLGTAATQKTGSAGVRWDFIRNADLTLQVDRTRLGASSAGTLVNIQPEFRRGGGFTLFSVAIDFVF